MMMKKFALLAGLFVFAPMTWAQDYNIKNGLPSDPQMLLITAIDDTMRAIGKK